MWLQLAARWPDHQDTAGQRHTITRTRWSTQPLASGHLALCATARTFIFSNIDFHVSTRPPKFRVAAYSITAVNRGADRAVYSSATLISIPCLLVAMVVNLLPRTSLDVFTYYYKYQKRKFMVNCFPLFLAQCNMLTKDIWIFTKLGQSKYSNWIFKQLFLRKRSVEQQ